MFCGKEVVLGYGDALRHYLIEGYLEVYSALQGKIHNLTLSPY
jgi:hypothetical protein